MDIWNFVRDDRHVPDPQRWENNGHGSYYRKFEPYVEYKSYCQRLRLIMIQHLDKVAEKYQEFFVDEELHSIVLD